MREIQAWRTSDGKIFDQLRHAKSHADKRFGDLLTKLAHEMVRVEKYAAAIHWIQENLDRFEELKALKKDLEIQKEGQFSDLED